MVKEWKLETAQDAYDMCHELWDKISKLSPEELEKLSGDDYFRFNEIKKKVLKLMGVNVEVESTCPYCHFYDDSTNCPFVEDKEGSGCHAVCANTGTPFDKFKRDVDFQNWEKAIQDAKDMVKWIEDTKVC